MDYEYVEEIPKDLECSICMGGLENPFVHYECERMFCEKCIKKVDRCPLCRKKTI